MPTTKMALAARCPICGRSQNQAAGKPCKCRSKVGLGTDSPSQQRQKAAAQKQFFTYIALGLIAVVVVWFALLLIFADPRHAALLHK